MFLYNGTILPIFGNIDVQNRDFQFIHIKYILQTKQNLSKHQLTQN